MKTAFVGHGSPMIALEDNQFTKGLAAFGEKLQEDQELKGILMVSAHWTTNQLSILDDPNPKMTYDMYGFPDELYQVEYHAPGATFIAKRVKELFGNQIITDNSWGYDHGNWTVMCHIAPKRNIPITQISIQNGLSMKEYFEIGEKLAPLRKEGIAIIGSGNVVHNLRLVDWSMETSGHTWAEEFDQNIHDFILSKQFDKVLAYEKLGDQALLSVPTTEHFAPLAVILGTVEQNESIEVMNKSCSLGALSMTGYVFGQ